MSTVQEIIAAIGTLSLEERAELKDWWEISHLKPEDGYESPELEAELLKAADGPFTEYSNEKMRDICEQVIREKREQSRK